MEWNGMECEPSQAHRFASYEMKCKCFACYCWCPLADRHATGTENYVPLPFFSFRWLIRWLSRHFVLLFPFFFLSFPFFSLLFFKLFNSIQSNRLGLRKENKSNRTESTSIDQAHYTHTIKSPSHSYASSSYNSSILLILILLLISVFFPLCCM